MIDLNCDVGESTGHHLVGNDEVLIPLVSSVNIACRGHAGDHQHTARAVQLAVEHGVQIGAHPSYPDRENFGRKKLALPDSIFRESILRQLNYLSEIVGTQPARIAYVKPHGALYHDCMSDPRAADRFLDVVAEFDARLAIVGQPDTAIESRCHQRSVHYVREAFADRKYQADGRLEPRSHHGAIIENHLEIAQQAVSLAIDQTVTLDSNHALPVAANTICIHGDTPGAVSAVMQILIDFAGNGIVVQSFQTS